MVEWNTSLSFKKTNTMKNGMDSWVAAQVEERYQELCRTPSDINLHLPILRAYADRCNHVTEFGVRGCVSLFAFLASKAARIVAVDILDVWVPGVEKLNFICADDLTIDIEETDMLFVDTRHCADQLRQELARHAGKVKHYLAMHDTFIFGRNGDDGKEGLLVAIEEFITANPEWRQVYHTDANNGLTILEKR